MTNINITFFSLIGGLLFFSFQSVSAETPHWQKTRYIEQSFYEIALKNEYNTNETRVRKWTKQLKIHVSHQVGDEALHQRLLNFHMTHLSDITGLPITFVKHKSQANIRVYFTRSNKVNQIIKTEIGPKSVEQLRGSVCLANIRVNKAAEIERAIVVIPIDRARMHGKLVSCVVEELTQILGLPNDSKTIYPTIFSDKNIYKLLTGLDYLLLKLLYSPEIKSGMTRAEAKPEIQKLLRKWQKDGTIHTAQQQVLKGELYALLGFR